MSKIKNFKDAAHFFSAFLTRPQHIGSVLPSSQFLARAMVKNLEMKPHESVLELGPGTGPLTKSILEFFPEPERFLAIDRESSFVNVLKARYPQYRFVCGEAQNMKALCDHNLKYPVRVVLSALPFTLFDHELQESILKALMDISSTGMVFRTFQYAHSYMLPQARRLRHRVSELFDCQPKKQFVLLNAPPAFVVEWIKK